MNGKIKEKIIFSNNFNETEFLRTLSKNGYNTFGVRVLNDAEICSYILIHNGKTMNGTYISDKEQSFIYFKILGVNLHDSINIKNAINSFRDCIVINSLNEMNNILSDNYKVKKDTIINAYKEYINYKKSNNLYDKHDMIEFIINNNLKVNDIDVEYYVEFDITKAFKDMVTSVFQNVKEVSISDNFNSEIDNNIEMHKVYGKSNEVELIFNKINKDNIPLDNCQIVLTNSKDMIELLPYLQKFNIPYTSAVGVPFIETKPAKLLKQLFDLKRQNYGVDGYKALFKSSAFNTYAFEQLFTSNDKLDVSKYNEFIKYAGWLRIGFDSKVNINSSLYDTDIAEALNILNDDMQLGIISFIEKYVVNNTNNNPIIHSMEELIKAKNIYKLNINDDELLSELFSSYINKQVSNCGSIHITNIDNSFASMRNYNFIIGLDENFPGNPKENYLIYDDEYQKTGSDIYLSNNIVERKINRTKKLIKISNNSILSYSYYGLNDLKEKNPSSIIYDLLGEVKGYSLEEFITGKDIKHPVIDFLSSDINENKNVIKARINNDSAKIATTDYTIGYDPKKLLSKFYTPSSIANFFESKLSFVLSNIFGLKIDDEDNPYTVIQANESGTLIHSLMEGFNKSDMTKPEFIKKAEIKFNEFLEKRPPIIQDSKSKALEEFNQIISNLYDMEHIDSKCIEYEKEISDTTIADIKFKGKFDRIEKDKNGNYILVDYKTGKTIKHENDDPITCLQGLIYAYMIEHTNNDKIISRGKRISKIEFRYPYLNKVISIDYSSENEKKMIEKIKEFKQAIQDHNFKCTEEDISKYDKKYQKLLSLYKGVL